MWSADYLVNRHLWPNIHWATGKALAALNEDAPVVLDIGCGHKPYRDLFNGARYVGIDHATDDASPDVITDARELPFQAQSIDIVFSTQVIEHVPHPYRMLAECGRVLKKGGFLVLTGPFYWPLHEEPYDFYRFTKYGFAQLLKDAGFSDWEIKEDGGDWAQIMLSINLHLNHRALAPARCAVNLLGMALDNIAQSKQSPANYTLWARR